jgi:heme A synthase
MVQRYPSRSKPVDLQRPPAPPSLVNAVKLMYAGAAVSTVSLILSLAESSTLKPAIRKQYPHWTASQVNRAFNGLVAILVVEAAIGIGLWLLMAWANKQGKNWARTAATILFALDTISALLGFSTEPKTLVGLLFPLLTWLIGLGAVVLLWRKENNDFYRPPA